jgi:ribosome-binding protein aMBF1 (putative translation factor)
MTDNPIFMQIQNALSKSQYTTHSFAQQMNIKLKVLESYLDGSVIPEKKVLSRMSKFLHVRLQ